MLNKNDFDRAQANHDNMLPDEDEPDPADLTLCSNSGERFEEARENLNRLIEESEK